VKAFDGDYRAAFKGEHLQAADFDKPYTVKIVGVFTNEIEEANRKKKEKLTLTLSTVSGKAIDRGWLISKTAAVCLAAMFGERAAGWKGKSVTLYKDPDVRFADEVTGGIRVLGSPDLATPTLRVPIRFKKKKPYVVTLKRTEAGKEQLPTADELAAPIDDGPPMGPTPAELAADNAPEPGSDG
jgi:hypothetical protein